MVMRAHLRMFLLAVLMLPALVFTSAAYAQQLQLSRVDFEVGVDYGVVAQFNSPCNLDNLHVNIDWGDGVTEALAISQPVPFPLPTGGPWSYHSPSGHVYKVPNTTYNLAWTLLKAHCTNATVDYGPWAPRKYTAKTYPRRNITSIARNANFPAVSGAQIEVKVTIDGPAFTSGARIYLKCLKGCSIIDPSFELTPFIDVPSGANDGDTRFQIAGHVANPTQMTIQASTSNSKPLTFTVRP